ncbi:hypothetical protein OIU78_030154 [Salix suchowensis]|nr:hypothetical protein OIU78_030154 [Salix suchowensis]
MFPLLAFAEISEAIKLLQSSFSYFRSLLNHPQTR